jgi:hypothetical protein
MGQIPQKKSKKSVFDFVIKGMQKIGFSRMFKTDQEKIIYNLRKNSKSERVILKSEEFLNDSEESSERTSEESDENDPKEFSRELEK